MLRIVSGVRRAAVAVVVAAVVALSATVAAQGPRTRRTNAMAWAPGARVLLYASTPTWGDPGRLFVLGRNGFEIIGPEVNAGISPSPDGKLIAISAPLDLFVIRPDGSGLRRLARNVTQVEAWSPGGSRLLFDSGDGYLYVIRRDGRSRRRLALINSDFDSHAVWSPDGRSVAYQACRPGLDPDVCDYGHLDLFVVDANGKRLRRITPRSLGNQCLLSWAPAHEIVYGTRAATVIATPRGKVVRAIPRFSCAAWSPDATRLLGVFHGLPAIVPAKGGAPRAIVRYRPRTVMGEGPAVPVWSPDGKEIAFSRVYAQNGFPLSHEYIADLQSGRVRRLP
jgi:Tol biopolymer transport system component